MQTQPMRQVPGRLVPVMLAVAAMVSQTPAADQVRLITLDPGHFHAGLVQKSMYPQVSPTVHVYAPEGPELQDHLKRVESFNARADNPTRWQEKIYTGADFLDRMVGEKAGNVVVIAGNNAHKTEYINRSVQAGFNVLADKPMAITPADFDLLRKSFDQAAKSKVLLYDIMTERFEITTILMRELTRMPAVFGTFDKGTPDKPAVTQESIHHFFKEVAGKPVIRPPWFFDVRQQGEAVPDVGTHLVDSIQWICFPEQTLDWRKDIRVLGARRWATTVSQAQFKQATGLERHPDFLKPNVGPNGTLNVFANGESTYTLRGIHAKVVVLWNFQAPPGTGDAFNAMARGSRATLQIKQGPGQRYKTTLYAENSSGTPAAEFERSVRAAVEKLCVTWPGLEVKPAGSSWEIVVPDKYRVSHEAHFGQVTENYLRFLADGKMPEWEVPNMIAKYYTTTEAYRLSHAGDTKR